MGCSPLLSRALKRLRGKGKKREKTRKSRKPKPEEQLQRSVSQGHQNPIYVAHPTVEIAQTWDPPQKQPDMSTTQCQAPHVFNPDTAETKRVVQVRYADTDMWGRNPTHYSFATKDPLCPRHELDFGCYGYSNSAVTGREYDGSSGHGSRAENFCGEYQCYPTPVREGIYSLATDGGRLTTMFSDENPNACNIV